MAKKITTYDELWDKIKKILPQAQFERDNFGQIIIYTNLVKSSDGLLKDFDPDNEDFQE